MSSHEQKQKGDLERQKGRLLEYCVKHKYEVEYILEEVGSGMSDTRTKLHRLCDISEKRQISKVVVDPLEGKGYGRRHQELEGTISIVKEI